MTRKLLPYEHQLIEELGITKEEYLGFLQVQFDYTTTPEQRLKTPQADFGVVALVLTIVGTLLQVASALLMPKPSAGGKRQAREQTFVPRFAFNSAQELAKYGDPVNLVYTNTAHNTNGGVRVATSLIWSAIESFGSSQYMQMMLVLGGGPINAIDIERMAFGQTPIRQFQAQSVWLYYNKNGKILFANKEKGGTDDPAFKGSASSDLVYRVNPFNGNRLEGFSQAFSPTTLTRCGVFSPVPINVDVVDRLSSGSIKQTPIGITADPAFVAAYWPATGARPLVPSGTTLSLTFLQSQVATNTKTDVIQTSSDKRRALLESIDTSSLYKLGAAKFRLVSISQPDLDVGDAVVTFVCVEPGAVCKEAYDKLDYRTGVSDAVLEAASDGITEYYHTKCLVKIEDAAYESITNANVVDFALKARSFQRISGRSRKYAEKKEEQFKNSDNGSKLRSSFFRLRYRQLGQEWKFVERIFVVRRGNDIDNFISLKFVSTASAARWQFQLLAVAETAADMTTNNPVDFAYIDNTGNTQQINNGDGTSIYFIGTLKARASAVPGGVADLPPLDDSPAELNEWALFSLRSDTQVQFSFDNGPEIEIKAVTEQTIEPLTTTLYSGLSLIGFNAYSGQGIQDLRSITAFVTQGKRCTVLTGPSTYTLSNSSSSFAPDIFLDTITDAVDGIGRFANIDGVDRARLWVAREFCKVNQLFMDGVIAEQTPWRQFWAEVAPFSLLEMGRIGGKETLVPAVPCSSSGAILSQVPISALFNSGNILEDSYKEEFIDYGTNVQDLIATVIYRDTESDGVFPRNRSVDVRRSGVTEEIAVRQTFDISQFVTNRNQAIMFAKLMCNQRRHIRKIIEFRTFPTDSVLSPGAYVYIDIGQAQWDNIYSGAVQAGGVLNTPISNIINGTYSVLLWKSGQSSVVPLNGISIVNNVAASLSAYEDWLFVLGTNVKSKRVFRITEVQMDEEGEVSVKAIEHPCDSSGNSRITAGLTDPSSTLFQIS